MITEPDYENLKNYRHDRTILVWSLAVSVGVNLLLWVLLTGGAFMHLVLPPAPKHELFTVTSSSFTISHENHPVAAQPQMQPRPVPPVQPRQVQAQPQPQQPVHREERPQPTAQPPELAREMPHAPAQSRREPPHTAQSSVAQELAQQQLAFSREAQQLNAQRAPLSVATADPRIRDSAAKQFQMNFSGADMQGQGEGILIPAPDDRPFLTSNGYRCHHLYYYYQYATGAIEHGDIPWPACYPANNDPFPGRRRNLPFPLPPLGYQLPPGTALQPQAKEAYQIYLDHQ